MSWLQGIAIFLCAGVGALLRWMLALALNHVFPQLPPGTLAANVLGAALMGVLLGIFAATESVSPLLRVALTTGFLGGLTTFSAFSAESATLVLQGDYRWAALHAIAHVGASLAATLAGLGLTRWWMALPPA